MKHLYLRPVYSSSIILEISFAISSCPSLLCYSSLPYIHFAGYFVCVFVQTFLEANPEISTWTRAICLDGCSRKHREEMGDWVKKNQIVTNSRLVSKSLIRIVETFSYWGTQENKKKKKTCLRNHHMIVIENKNAAWINDQTWIAIIVLSHT